MGLFDFLKRKKKKAEGEGDELLDLGDAGLSELRPPETRYTQEYKDFLASQEAAEQSAEPSGGEDGE